MGYPDLLILIGFYVRWTISGFNKEKGKKYIDEDKKNFVVFLLFVFFLVSLVAAFNFFKDI